MKGQGIHCFVVLREGVEPSGDLRKDLIRRVRVVIGPIAKLDRIQFATDLPKTRSGKIMRRILRRMRRERRRTLGIRAPWPMRPSSSS